MGFKDLDETFGDIPNYPGKKPPKNRGATKPASIENPLDLLKPVYFTVRGERQAFFTVGQVATVLNRKTGTLRMWETRGYIP